MRFDILTVFPEFFDVLNVSLVGKARSRGLIDLDIHDLRDWTTDVHRTVDDTPFGGGAGMVMKPDVWGEAIDDVVARAASTRGGKTVLAIPTPGGVPLTQRTCYELAEEDHIIIACGRYEGIDSRISQYYAKRDDFEVMEFSLGDYVLNGGEVAATALVEAVGRLVPGMVGNPESLVEESHGDAGLLEYPVYTRPADFRGEEVPEVLTSGNHKAIARWRRDRAIERTAARRPDMIAKLTELDKKDLKLLAGLGWVRQRNSDGPLTRAVARRAEVADVERLAALAAETFPDACPPEIPAETIEKHIADKLSVNVVNSWVNDPREWVVTVLEIEGVVVGYSLVRLSSTETEVAEGAPVDAVVGEKARDGELLYLSKLYLAREWRGSGAFEALMNATLEAAAQMSTGQTNPYIWIGTNVGNRRAINAYKKAGFEKVGTREFVVGDVVNKDVTLARQLPVTE